MIFVVVVVGAAAGALKMNRKIEIYSCENFVLFSPPSNQS
jgi:hypothetical protein